MAEITGVVPPSKNTIGSIGDIYINTITGQKYELLGIYDTSDTDTDAIPNEIAKEYDWGPVIKNGSPEQLAQIEKNKTDIADLYKSKANVIIDTVSGESIVISDGAEARLENLRVFGKSEQNTISGKNLCNITLKDQTISGVTFTVNEDKSITVNGTCTNDIYMNIGVALLDANKEYRISGCPKFAVWNDAGLYVNDNALSGNVWDRGETSIFIMANTQEYPCALQLRKDVVFNNVIFYPMIRLSSNTDATYEPYTGGIPSPNPEYPQEIRSVGGDGDIEVGAYGKNLHPNELGDYDRVNETGERVSHARGTHASYPTTFSIPIGKTLTVSHNHIFSGGVGVVKLMQYDENNKYIGRNEKSGKHNIITFTPDKKCRYMNIVIYDENGVSLDGIEIQVEVGTEATPYEPYKPKQSLTIPTPNGLPGIKVTDASNATYTDADGQMWCADEIDFERGVYVQRIYEQNLPIANATKSSSTNRFLIQTRFLDKSPLLRNDLIGSVLSDKFIGSENQTAGNNTISLAVNGYVSIGYDASKTKQDFINEFTDKPIKILYILETPIETPLSAEEIEAYKALYTNYPNTTILNDSGAHMEVSYVVDTKKYIDRKFSELATALVAMGG